ncbi:hypothetical protein SDRG_14684 [Saprolegnia diclina VS20]|uniref:NAD-dependent epimerase/dehydratase domain-containing protein n=1 Tax=Saprolegnia diclina (strain VS20) TaxID=1156394 RepID=T0PZ37_SAPDV|nr:hypothetical protein SDRG_14684 [Saprolegnia diclina VS20]EQC27481.1 hypothetical protein SDRG_14684 [Saprolegnia diclina VS20]|eukprot:XP_008619055.1 hypothetical protein SDRG_14684 [Saprolegnia diclina VS20]
MPAKKIAFVTGATGFLGRNLVDALLRDDAWHVIALHRPSSKIAPLVALGVDCVLGDIHDASSIASVLPMDVDAVFHVAANTTFWKPMHAAQWADNVDATSAMCDAALTRRAKRFVFVSSTAAYGYRNDIIDESTAQTGASAPIHYFRTKAAAEKIVRAAVARGLAAVIVNPTHILGPHDSANWARLFTLISRKKLTGIPPGAGSFSYAPFVANAIVAAADRGRVGHNYILHGPTASFQELVYTASLLLGKSETRQPLPAPLLRFVGRLNEFVALFTRREPDITYEGALAMGCDPTVQSTKAIDELGYEQLPVAESIAKTIDWLRSEKHLP